MSRLSYHHVPHARPLEVKFYHQFLDSVAEHKPDNEALVMYDMNKTRSVMTYGEYREWSVLLASSLLELGLSRAHRVLLIGASSIRFAVSAMALHRVGASIILLGPGGITDDKVELLKKIGLQAIVFDPVMTDTQQKQLKRAIQEIISFHQNDRQLLVSLGDEPSSKQVCNVFRTYSTLLDLGRSKGLEDVLKAQRELLADQPSVAVFTSGSTGASKLAQHVLHLGLSHYAPPEGKPPERVYFDRPMAWGWGYGHLLQMSMGTTIVWVPTEMALSDATNESVFEIMMKEKCTSCMLGLTLIYKMVSEKLHLKYDLSHVRSFTIGGQSYPMALVKAVFECLPTSMARLSYGSTEIALIMIAVYTKGTLNEKDYGKMSALPGVEVRVVDEENRIAPRGGTGEVCIRSHSTFLEYLGNPVATKQAKTPTGWYYTGDIGKMDDKGRIQLLGRKKDFIKRATLKIFPAEIESVLMKHPAIDGVVVVGVPDQRYQEEICACVIWKNEKETNTEARLAELVTWCKQEWPPGADGLSLKPKYFVPVSRFPLLESGKIDRKGLRAFATNALGIEG